MNDPTGLNKLLAQPTRDLEPSSPFYAIMTDENGLVKDRILIAFTRDRNVAASYAKQRMNECLDWHQCFVGETKSLRAGGCLKPFATFIRPEPIVENG
jgi:hypothetical protein